MVLLIVIISVCIHAVLVVLYIALCCLCKKTLNGAEYLAGMFLGVFYLRSCHRRAVLIFSVGLLTESDTLNIALCWYCLHCPCTVMQ